MTEVKAWRARMVSSYYAALRRAIELTPIVNYNPNTISVWATVAGLFAALFFFLGHSFTAGMFLLISGTLDTMDGTVARMKDKATRFGAIVDSSLDRYVEFAIFLGILNYYREAPTYYWAFAALVGSIMVSYARARAQSLGVQEIVGLMQRAERLILLSLGAIINAIVHLVNGSDAVLHWTIVIIAVGANITALQRIFIVKRVEEREGS